MTKDPIELLKTVYPQLDNGTKKAVAEAAEIVKEIKAELADLQSAIARQPLPEAPASATVKVVDQSTQMEWLVTVRDPAYARLLIRELGDISALLNEVGFIASIDSRGAGRQSAATAPDSAPTTAPMCPTHNRPMKQSQRGGWYCTAKIVEDGGDGKPVYCKQKA